MRVPHAWRHKIPRRFTITLQHSALRQVTPAGCGTVPIETSRNSVADVKRNLDPSYLVNHGPKCSRGEAYRARARTPGGRSSRQECGTEQLPKPGKDQLADGTTTRPANSPASATAPDLYGRANTATTILPTTKIGLHWTRRSSCWRTTGAPTHPKDYIAFLGPLLPQDSAAGDCA